MDVQTDAALEAMAETPALSLATATSPTSSSSSGSMSSPKGAVGGLAQPAKSGSSVVVENLRGYPKEITQSPVEDKFLCGYCELILRQPLQSECGHRFCAGCRVFMTSLPKPVVCNLCVEEGITDDSKYLNLEEMFEDKAAKREMRRLPCKCINPGCSWKGTFNDFINDHETSCDKKKLPCPLCGSLLPQNKLPHHQANDCPKREVTCQYCGQHMLDEELEGHQKACPQLPIICPRCQSSVPRNEFESHNERECIHREMVCPVPGCQQKMSRDQFPQHLSESPKQSQKHLLYLFDRTEFLEREVTRLANQQPLAAPDPRQVEAGGGGAARQHQGMAAAAEGGLPPTEQPQASIGAGSAAPLEPAEKLKLHEDLMSVLHGEILRCIRQVEALSTGHSRDKAELREVQAKLQHVEGRIRDFQPPTQPPVSAAECGKLVESGDGVATWCLLRFSDLRRAAVDNVQHFVDSPTFSTGSLGYSLRLRLYPDGDGQSKGRGLSVYLQLLPGLCDDLLWWPFQAEIHFVLIDHKDFRLHKTASLKTAVNSQACRRPPLGADYNHQGALGLGLSSLISLNEMEENRSRYNFRDTVYLRVFVRMNSQRLSTRLKDLDPLQNPGTANRDQFREAQQPTT